LIFYDITTVLSDVAPLSVEIKTVTNPPEYAGWVKVTLAVRVSSKFSIPGSCRSLLMLEMHHFPALPEHTFSYVRYSVYLVLLRTPPSYVAIMLNLLKSHIFSLPVFLMSNETRLDGDVELSDVNSMLDFRMESSKLARCDAVFVKLVLASKMDGNIIIIYDIVNMMIAPPILTLRPICYHL